MGQIVVCTGIPRAVSAACEGARGKSNTPKVSTHAAPAGEPLSEDYALTVSGTPVPVYVCRVSAVPFNQVWPGYQRPADQTELAAFAYCDAAAAVSVEVTCRRKIESVAVRPKSRNIAPSVKGQHISFEVPEPGQFIVEVNGPHNALHLFINPPERTTPQAAGRNVLYFGPGVHRPGKIMLESNQTVYVASGAVVYGCIQARHARNLRILGRGVVDVSEFQRDQAGGAIRLEDCTEVTLDGLVLRDPDNWCCGFFGCSNVEVSNLKLVGLWRYNSDGIDFCNSENIRIRDSFVRSFDDCIVLKGLKWDAGASYDQRPVRNVLVERCVLWNDWDRTLEIGAETHAPEIANVRYRDCDIVRATHVAMDIQNGDRADVHDIRYENIRVEVDDFNPPPRMQHAPGQTYTDNHRTDYRPLLMSVTVNRTAYSTGQLAGVVRNVVFKDISVTGKLFPASVFRGTDEKHNVAGVTIENLKVNGRQCTNAHDAQIAIQPFVSGVTFVPGQDR